ncbi:Alpha/Beta hydrolase protein [Crepidotus variabilis]|uniref:Carboxypeptidase n=1 Tax=Crepidotus variabilis TaxID=179855 RepID=A0A9P6E9Q6_9AGAR|nr:Alpha/Beta hydrolase protein [Crepidotus variabilis]
MVYNTGAWSRILAFSSFLYLVTTQDVPTPPSSYPHDYPGKPSGDFGPQWQKYFKVNDKLPNVTFPITQSYAGNLPVNRAGHPNDTLFFWGFEKSPGSLSAPLTTSNGQPWGIWLNGGPGSSSLYGLLFENGPININPDYSASSNNHSWNKLADYFWVDQPVGVGYATADETGYAPDEDQIGKDFMGFLSNLVKVFPSLAQRPLQLTGESYAGQYIPYILKAYFDMPKPPVKITNILIGDGTYTTGQVFELAPSLSVLETYPQIIGYDVDVYNYFKEQNKLCKFDINLTYPQHGLIPDPGIIYPTQRNFSLSMKVDRFNFASSLKRRSVEPEISLAKREAARQEWKREVIDQGNGTINPWYGCFLINMYTDYAYNYTFPWNITTPPVFDVSVHVYLKVLELKFSKVYNIPDALNPEENLDASVFLNNPRVRTALHAPTVKDWQLSIDFPFGTNPYDPSPEAINFFNALATNATKKNVGIHLISGNNDALVAHFGTEVAIQNTTFGGIQGFTRQPSTPWNTSDGKFAAVVHQERGWTYALFYDAGHMIPRNKPLAAYEFFRDFVLGKGNIGTVTSPKPGITTVVGGEDPKLKGVIRGADPIYYGSGATQSTYVFPAATRAAWKKVNNAYQPTGSP